MKKDDALSVILAEWRQLPESERATEDQLAAFAMGVKDKYAFNCSGDKYQHIFAFLQRKSPGLKKTGL